MTICEIIRAPMGEIMSMILSHLYRTVVLKANHNLYMMTELEVIAPEERASRDEKIVENIMKTAQIHLVVASLIMTVTFTAGFTLPGGFESDTNSPNKGMAILIRKAAFRAFVVSDAIAFSFSSAAVFAYFSMSANAILAARELTTIIKNYNTAIAFQVNAMAAVVVAFATGMYCTLEQSLGLAVTVCVISCFTFVSSVAMFLPQVRSTQRT